jgi:hypothetical protein
MDDSIIPRHIHFRFCECELGVFYTDLDILVMTCSSTFLVSFGIHRHSTLDLHTSGDYEFLFETIQAKFTIYARYVPQYKDC